MKTIPAIGQNDEMKSKICELSTATTFLQLKPWPWSWLQPNWELRTVWRCLYVHKQPTFLFWPSLHYKGWPRRRWRRVCQRPERSQSRPGTGKRYQSVLKIIFRQGEWQSKLGRKYTGCFFLTGPKSVWGWTNPYQKSESGAIQQQHVKF